MVGLEERAVGHRHWRIEQSQTPSYSSPEGRIACDLDRIPPTAADRLDQLPDSDIVHNAHHINLVLPVANPRARREGENDRAAGYIDIHRAQVSSYPFRHPIQPVGAAQCYRQPSAATCEPLLITLKAGAQCDGTPDWRQRSAGREALGQQPEAVLALDVDGYREEVRVPASLDSMATSRCPMSIWLSAIRSRSVSTRSSFDASASLGGSRSSSSGNRASAAVAARMAAKLTGDRPFRSGVRSCSIAVPSSTPPPRISLRSSIDHETGRVGVGMIWLLGARARVVWWQHQAAQPVRHVAGPDARSMLLAGSTEDPAKRVGVAARVDQHRHTITLRKPQVSPLERSDEQPAIIWV